MTLPAILPQLADISPNPSSSSSTQATGERRPSHIESYGVHCQEPTCNLGDFLPFKCGYCKLSYCSYHRLPFSHSCSAYDESKLDNRATLCQWCEEPLRVDMLNGRETDINTAMEWHISNGQCKVLKDVGKDGLWQDSRNGNSIRANKMLGDSSSKMLTNKQKKENEKKCTYGKCKNIMWVDIKCPACGDKFCPSHRDKKSHKCGEERAMNPHNDNSSSRSTSSLGRPVLSTSRPSAIQQGIKTLSLSASSSSPLSSSEKSNTTQTTKANVIQAIKGKTSSNVSDMSSSRRAAREREQAAMALKNRAKKGLLTEDEKVRYATLQALEAQQGSKTSKSGKDRDCCIQ